MAGGRDGVAAAIVLGWIAALVGPVCPGHARVGERVAVGLGWLA
jgi:hypothetical protein